MFFLRRGLFVSRAFARFGCRRAMQSTVVRAAVAFTNHPFHSRFCLGVRSDHMFKVHTGFVSATHAGAEVFVFTRLPRYGVLGRIGICVRRE